MIQDISPSRFSLDYQIQTPSAGDIIILLHKNQFFLTSSKSYPLYEQLDFD